MRTLRLVLLLLSLAIVNLLAADGSGPFYPPEFGEDKSPADFGSSDPRYQMDVVGHLSLPLMGAVVASGNYMYNSAGSGIFIIDISTPAEPTIQKHIYFPTGLNGHGTAIVGNYLYVTKMDTTRHSVLAAYNISDPLSPVAEGECPFPGFPNEMLVSGQRLVALSTSSIEILDISTPGNPVLVGSQARSSGRYSSVAENYIYAVEGRQLRVIDFSDPTNMVTVATDSRFHSPGSLTTEGNRLYIVDDESESIDRVYAFDISNPAAIEQLGTYPGEIYGGLMAIGGYVYVTRGQNGPAHVIDFTNPVSPQIVGSTPTDSWSIYRDGNRLYFGAFEHCDIVDVSVPASPQYRGRYEALYSAFDAFDFEGDLGVGSFRDLHIFDLSDRTQPKEVGIIDLPGSFIIDVAIKNQVVYTVNAYSLNTVDVSDPANPILTSSESPFNSAWLVVADGDRVVTGGDYGIQIFDLSDPLHPAKRGIFTDYDRWMTKALCLHGPNLFVCSDNGNGNTAVTILDVSDLSAPVKLGEYTSNQIVLPALIDVQGDQMFLFNGPDFEIVDVSSPSDPKPTGNTFIPYGSASGVEAVGDYSYVGSRTIAVIDIYNPQFPQTVAIHDFGAYSSRIKYDSGYLYCYTNGTLLVMQPVLPTIMNGDCDNNALITVSDAVYLINFIFASGAAPMPYRSADVNCDHLVTISDAVYLINFIFAGGPEPCAQ